MIRFSNQSSTWHNLTLSYDPRRQRYHLHPFLLPQFRCHNPQHPGSQRLLLAIEQYACVVIKPDVPSVRP